MKKIFIFIAGLCVGSIATFKIANEKYKRISDEEIRSIREMYRNKKINKKNVENEQKNKDDEQKPNEDYEKMVKDLGYDVKEFKKENEMKNERIYVIPPEDFGEYGYETISLIYYADGVLTYDDNKIVKNVDGVVGVDSLKRFGEYEDDSVFVRNEILKKDYEILMDVRKYSNISKKPHIVLDNDD